MKKSFPTLPRKTISDRPPAALPEDAEIPFEDNPEYIPIGYNTLPSLDSRRSSAEYECVKPRSSTIPRLKNATLQLTQGKNQGAAARSLIVAICLHTDMESQSDDYDRDYVISNINASHQQTYLHGK